MAAPINWYPGHMNKARREIAKAMPKVNLLIEVLDARIPFTSENPMVAQLRGDTPCIKVLNKSDMADPAVTEAWLHHFEKEEGVTALALNGLQPKRVKRLIPLGKSLLPADRSKGKTITTMILGIPNVGKSTIINTLAGRTIAKTGNKPAVTKMQQRIYIDHSFALLDTPGFLWPKLSPPSCGFKLAVTGAVRDAVVSFEDLAFYAVAYLAEHYPDQIQARYKLSSLGDDEMSILEAIAGKRGCIGRGGIVNLQKVSELFIREYRQCSMGRLSLETPEQIAAEQGHAETRSPRT
jgi:ribosome biogenesis GTPase A